MEGPKLHHGLEQASVDKKVAVGEAALAFYDFLLAPGEWSSSRDRVKDLFLSWKAKHWHGRSVGFAEVLFCLSRSKLCRVESGDVIVWKLRSALKGVDDDELGQWLRRNDLTGLQRVLNGTSLATLLGWTEEDFYDYDFKGKKVEYTLVKKLKEAVAETKKPLPAEKKAGTQVGRLWFDSSSLLGRGSSGTIVFRGSVEGRDAAVKRLDKDLWSLAEKEIAALQQGRCDESKHVVSYYGHERDNAYIYLALSRCSNTLGKCLENKGEVVCQLDRVDERLRVLHELALGIAHLHDLGIIHRDLTPSNVLLDMDGIVKISDMGLARKIVDGQGHVSTTSQGTAGWQPVEVLERSAQSEKVDIFSFGCIAFFVLTLGKHPFGEQQEWVLRIVKDRPDFSPLHRLQGVLKCRQHPMRRFGSKMDLQQHFLKTSHEIPAFVSIKNCLACSMEFRSDADRDAHDCDIAPHIMFTAEELLLRCLSQDAELRPSVGHVLSHPLFWNSERRLCFLQIVSDWWKADASLVAKVDQENHSVYGSEGWQAQPGVRELLVGRYESGLSHLVRLVRNVALHYREQVEFAARFKSLEDVCDFFELRFPQLLIAVWLIVQKMAERSLCPDLAQFFVDI